MAHPHPVDYVNGPDVAPLPIHNVPDLSRADDKSLAVLPSHQKSLVERVRRARMNVDVRMMLSGKKMNVIKDINREGIKIAVMEK